jgi:hypothetical protein
MRTAIDTKRLDNAIRSTIKAFKEATAVQIWTWAMNREGNLLAIEDRLEDLADAGFLVRILHSWPLTYKMGRWR